MSTIFFLLVGHKACGILVPQPGPEPRANYWPTREVPKFYSVCSSITIPSLFSLYGWASTVSMCEYASRTCFCFLDLGDYNKKIARA